jgi:hypothetical protein
MLTGYKMKRLLAGVLIIVCVVVILLNVSSLVFEPQTPRNYVPVYSEKFYAYPRLDPQPDIVFVGSSRVYRGLWPEYVESAFVTEKSSISHVYNFGSGGMTAPMQAKIYDFLVSNSVKPQMIFIEPQMVFGAAFRPDVNQFSRFSNQFSTLPIGLLQIFAQQEGGFRSKIERLRDYIISFARTGFGTGSVRDIFMHDEIQNRLKLSGYFIQHDGFYPLDMELKDAEGRRRKKRLVQRRANNSGEKGEKRIVNRYHKVKRVMKKSVRPITRMERWYVELLLGRANSENIKCGFIFMPMLNPLRVERQRAIIQYLRKHHPDVLILGSDPLQMPDIYNASLWFDGGHLNSEGAKLFSRELGRQLSKLVIDGAV